MENTAKDLRKLIQYFKASMAEHIIGQDSLIEHILIAYIANGHVLLEGAPGLAKTSTVRVFAALSGLQFKRIQFTPDLLPSDLTGTLIFDPDSRTFSVRKGPVFAHIILADEINRAPAKVQSALLEAMAEGQITIGETSYELPRPFFVLATQNPIEQEGTYPLPEAELDRFLLKVFVPYPSVQDEINIMLNSTAITAAKNIEQDTGRIILTQNHLAAVRNAVSQVECSAAVNSYIVSLVAATRPSTEKKGNLHRGDYLSYISVGASPRASIALYTCAKAHAFLRGRAYVIPDDVKAMAYPVLRHRLKLSYEAAAESVSADEVVKKLLQVTPQP